MGKKIFLLAASLFFFSQVAFAEHQWVWENEDVAVYVEDTTAEVSEDGKEFSVTVIDVLRDSGIFNLRRFNFYRREENWFYSMTGQGVVNPVTHTNASGYILDFAEKNLLSSSKKNSVPEN